MGGSANKLGKLALAAAVVAPYAIAISQRPGNYEQKTAETIHATSKDVVRDPIRTKVLRNGGPKARWIDVNDFLDAGYLDSSSVEFKHEKKDEQLPPPHEIYQLLSDLLHSEKDRGEIYDRLLELKEKEGKWMYSEKLEELCSFTKGEFVSASKYDNYDDEDLLDAISIIYPDDYTEMDKAIHETNRLADVAFRRIKRHLKKMEDDPLAPLSIDQRIEALREDIERLRHVDIKNPQPILSKHQRFYEKEKEEMDSNQREEYEQLLAELNNLAREKAMEILRLNLKILRDRSQLEGDKADETRILISSGEEILKYLEEEEQEGTKEEGDMSLPKE